MSDYTARYYMDVTTYPGPNLDGGLSNLGQ